MQKERLCTQLDQEENVAKKDIEVEDIFPKDENETMKGDIVGMVKLQLLTEMFQCPVCHQAFVGSVSLNCGHTFCTFCMAQWRGERNNCPVCRTGITHQVEVKVSTLVLSL